jgi:hypothetical protein
MKEFSRPNAETPTPDLTLPASPITEVQSASAATPAASEITVPACEPLPDYMDSSKYFVDVRGPGGFVDIRAVPASPPRDTGTYRMSELPELPESECMQDMRSGSNSFVDMRSPRFKSLIRAVLREQQNTAEE